MTKHASQPFNPDIANTFFRAGMVESWGRGIEHIMTLCKDAGKRVPLFRYESSGLWVEFPLPSGATVQVTEQVTEQVAEQVADEISREVTMLLLSMKGEMRKSEILNALGLKNRNNLSRLYLKPAIGAGLIEMTIPESPNSRLQKYRLTNKGNAVVISLGE